MSGWYTAGLAHLADPTRTSKVELELVLVDDGYTFNEDHDSYADGISTNEITATNYARKPLTESSLSVDDASDVASLMGSASATWSALGAGDSPSETVDAIIVGIDGEDIPLLYLDENITVVLAAPAASSDTTIYTWPLEAGLADNTDIDFGAVTATTNGAASEGDTSVTVDALSGAISVGANGTAAWTSDLPHTCDGSDFEVSWS